MVYRRLATLFLLAALAAAGCSAPYASNWSQVRRGMSEDEVRGLLGPPRSRFVAADDLASSDSTAVLMSASEAALGYAERWVYGEPALGIRSGLERGLKYRAGSAYHVYFDETGHVINFQAPEPTSLDTSIVVEPEY